MVSSQKKVAAKILKVGVTRVWLNPKNTKDIRGAITRNDIKKLIKKGDIKALPVKVSRPAVEGRDKRGEGKRKGSRNSIVSSKRKWINTVRPLRRYLKELKTTQQLDNTSYHKMRMLAKGGMFRSRSHLRLYLEQHGLLKKKE